MSHTPRQNDRSGANSADNDDSTAETVPDRAVWLAVVWLLVFFRIFFSIDLPNSVPTTHRADLWLELPELLISCVVQNPDATETRWSFFFSQRLGIALLAGLILSSAVALGRLAMRGIGLLDSAEAGDGRAIERNVLSAGLGLSGLSLLTLGLGLLAQAVPVAMSRAVLASAVAGFVLLEAALIVRERRRVQRDDSAGAGLAARQASRAGSRAESVNWSDVLLRGQIPFGVLSRMAAGIAIGCFVVAMLLGATLPSIDFDVKEYHLEGPKEHFLNGSVGLLPHNVYTSFPFLTEMLTLLGMILAGDWFAGALVGKAVLMSFGPLTGLALFATGRRWFGDRVAWTAALIFLTTPWTYRISVIAYAEGGLTFYLFATLFVVLRVLDAAQSAGVFDRRLVFLAGLFAGSSMACKYPGVLSVVLPLGLTILWRVFRRKTTQADSADPTSGSTDSLPTNRELDFSARLRAVLLTGLVYSAGVLIAVGPWLAKNAAETGNPVYPLLHRVFGGSDWTPTLDENWKLAHSPPHHQPFDLLVKFYDVTCKSDWLSPLLFGLAPLSLFVSRRRRMLRGLWLYVGFLFLSWWLLTHRIDRFWIPLIPIVSLLSGVGVWRLAGSRVWRVAAGAFVVLSVFFNLGYVSTHHCGLNLWLADLDAVRATVEQSAPSIAAVNRLELPPGSKVLCVGEAQVFDARFPLIYNTVFDISIFEEWCSAASPGVAPGDQLMKPTAGIRDTFRARGVTHILVNWQEILRYRATYGYSEFVTPRRFDWLQKHGVLDDSVLVLAGERELAPNDEHPQQREHQQIVEQIEHWAPEILQRRGTRWSFPTSVLYRVSRD